MKMGKIFGLFMLVLISTVLAAGFAAAATVPVVLDEIEIDGTEVVVSESCELADDNVTLVCEQVNSINLLDVERGEDIDVKLRLTALDDDENVQVKVALRGYEYDDRDKTSDITHVFDIEENVTYVKWLDIEVPDKMEGDDYKLRVTVTNRNDEVKYYEFDVRVSAERHALKIKDVDFFPESGVKAGEHFEANVRVKNIGDKDEESVKVRVMVPELGISASEYIDMIESGDTESSEALWVRIPECAEEGLYQVLIEVQYDELYESVRASKIVQVESDACEVPVLADAEEEEEEVEFDFISDLTEEAEEQDEESQVVLRNVLEIGLIGLIVALVILGLIVGFMNLTKEKEEF